MPHRDATQSRQQLQKQQSELLQENQLLWVERYLLGEQLGVDAADGSSLVQAVQEAVQADVRYKRRQRLRQQGIDVRAAALAAAAGGGVVTSAGEEQPHLELESDDDAPASGSSTARLVRALLVVVGVGLWRAHVLPCLQRS